MCYFATWQGEAATAESREGTWSHVFTCGVVEETLVPSVRVSEAGHDTALHPQRTAGLMDSASACDARYGQQLWADSRATKKQPIIRYDSSQKNFEIFVYLIKPTT